jgi:hypothetical protein
MGQKFHKWMIWLDMDGLSKFIMLDTKTTTLEGISYKIIKVPKFDPTPGHSSRIDATTRPERTVTTYPPCDTALGLSMG